ncbi:MAG: Crp/Fnr family transcriptional regulator [Bacteroidetes bacterium]|nr:Crp/Fnr family transcriptional regulator [Bacteroidota bacterium]
MQFKDKLQEYYKLTNQDWEISIKYFKTEIYNANTFFLKQDTISDKLGFVKSGLLYSFVYNENLDEVTSHFFQAGDVVISIESFNNQTPTTENIFVFDNAELLTITYSDIKELYKIIPIWQQICKDVAEMKNKNLINRILQFQTLSATERYQQFCTKFPEIIKKVPLRLIASYLGIDIATLSRIRKKK